MKSSTNFPLSISPINLKSLIFSDKGTIIFDKSISIFLFIFVKIFFLDFPLKYFSKLLASYCLPLILIFLS